MAMALDWDYSTGILECYDHADFRNFDGLTRIPGTKVYALDLLGMGNSSRPHFQVRAKDPVAKIDEAEAFFIDALEEWRKEKKIEKMTLLVRPILIL